MVARSRPRRLFPLILISENQVPVASTRSQTSANTLPKAIRGAHPAAPAKLQNMDLVNRLVNKRHLPIVRELIALLGMEIPRDAQIGDNFRILHRGFGTVIHPNTVIGRDVTVFHGVTLGRADAWRPMSDSHMRGFSIGDGAVLCTGAKILCKSGTLSVGRGTIIAANAVLVESTGENEIWAGIPARKVGMREDPYAQ